MVDCTWTKIAQVLMKWIFLKQKIMLAYFWTFWTVWITVVIFTIFTNPQSSLMSQPFFEILLKDFDSQHSDTVWPPLQNAVNYLNITPNEQKYTAILPSCLMWFAFLFDLFTANGAAGSEQTEVGLGFSNATWFHWAFLVQAEDLPVHQAHPKKACSDFCCSLCHR